MLLPPLKGKESLETTFRASGLISVCIRYFHAAYGTNTASREVFPVGQSNFPNLSNQYLCFIEAIEMQLPIRSDTCAFIE